MNHLHIHTDGSVLDGVCGVERLVNRVKELGMDAVGISDHGSMIKAFAFQKECIKQGVKPIIGCEFYMGEPDTKDVFHILLIAKTDEGLKNMYKLSTYSYTKNFFSKPRISMDELIARKDGLICLTACIGSELGHLYLNGRQNAIQGKLERLKGIFGGDLYLEIQPNKIPKQKGYNEALVRYSHELGIPLVATCDAHYVYREDAKAHDVMLCMQTGKKVGDTDRFRFDGDDFYIKTEDEVRMGLDYLSPTDIGNAIRNTGVIASMCSARIATGLSLAPSIGVENEHNELCVKCNLGWMDRLRKHEISGSREEMDRIAYELSIIKQKNYSGYFLIVEDFIAFAKQKGIMVGPGRGSAAGSMVAYLLGITDVNPMKYHLLFERMLNPERNSLPDIDSDFCYERREEVIQYVVNKYGADKVAHVMAEGTLACNSSARKVLSAYGFDQKVINAVCKTIPKELHITLDEAYNKSRDFKNYMDMYPEQFDVMKRLEGLIDHTSTHAAGITIMNQPVDDCVPCMSSSEDRSVLITQWHKKIIEEIGVNV